MNFTDLNVPQNVHFLSEWNELPGMLPCTGKYILNKVKTGCGGTTMFLESETPVILVSPRSAVLYSKSAQYPNAHLFRSKLDTSTSPIKLKDRLKDYIDACTITSPWCNMPIRIPKILVTIDSYIHVAEQLSHMGILDQFTILVDEFQCIMSDSKFKGRTELEFLHNLNGVKCICYLSATPIEENYIATMPDFDDVQTYFKLIWDPSMLETPNLSMQPYKKKQSSKSICKEIIDNFKKNGYFARKIVDGNVVESKEVVFFLNDVRTISQIIIANSLNPDDVNVLCSPSNKRFQDIKKLKVHTGELSTDPNNPQNRTFTFATRASFEGVDFYSNQAMTYIFCDGTLDWNKNDLIIDVPQILGRQRLVSNPFRKDAILYYRPSYKVNLDEAKNKIQSKSDATERWIQKFNASDSQTKLMLIDGIHKRSEKLRYEDDYVEVIDDKCGGFAVRENYLVRNTEIRDCELSNFVYNNPLTILKTVVDKTDINVFSTHGFVSLTGEKDLDTFNRTFFKSTAFPEKMESYCLLREKHPEYDDVLYRNILIDIKFHHYYNILGPDKLKSLRFREKDIATAAGPKLKELKIKADCLKTFEKGKCYTLSEVKTKLKDIFVANGIGAPAKAKDLQKYMSVKERQITNKDTSKRDLCYEIL